MVPQRRQGRPARPYTQCSSPRRATPVVMMPNRSLLALSSRWPSSTRARRSATWPTGRHGLSPAQEQHFGNINIADAGQVALIEQRLADRPLRLLPQAADRLGAVPVRAEQVRAEVTDDRVLVLARYHLHHREQVPDRLPGVVGQHDPDPVVGRPAAAGRPDPPRAVHPQVRVHGLAVVGPDQQVLPARDHGAHGAPGQVRGGEPRDPEVAAGQHPPGQRLAQLPGGPPDGVTLGHRPGRFRAA